jgi:3,4-dihydroxy 2-butanone 4-phosphate synthase/GTP cyclohydrolase II
MFSPIPEILEELRSGRMVVLVDDESRENEGDLIIAAEKVTPETINFMATQGRGLICLALTSGRCNELGLDLMASDKDSKLGTAFTVSIDAATGVTSGVSAHDRAKTILTAIDDFCRPSDLVIPGRIFPLRAREGRTLVRAGHTEGSVDLACLAELKPAAVICEIMKEDGTMARIPDLVKFCKKHQLKLASIADIIEYRRRSEKLIEKIADADLSTAFGRFHFHYYKSLIDENVHLALTSGQVGRDTVEENPVLVRVHSQCLAGEVFHSLHCDCRPRLEKSLIRIAREGKGVFLYIRQREQHARLVHEVKPPTLQEKRQNTVYARAQLGQHSDLREYGIGAQILLDLGIRKMRLLTNNTKKIHALTGYGLEVVDQLPIEIAPRPDSQLAPEQI